MSSFKSGHGRCAIGNVELWFGGIHGWLQVALIENVFAFSTYFHDMNILDQMKMNIALVLERIHGLQVRSLPLQDSATRKCRNVNFSALGAVSTVFAGKTRFFRRRG